MAADGHVVEGRHGPAYSVEAEREFMTQMAAVRGQLLATAAAIVGPDLAEDVVQTAILRTWIVVGQLTGENCYARWARYATRSAAIDMLRLAENSRTRAHSLDSLELLASDRAQPSAEFAALRGLDTGEVLAVLNSMNRTAAEVLMARDGLGMSYDEILLMYPMTPLQLRNTLRRARREFRSEFEARRRFGVFGGVLAGVLAGGRPFGLSGGDAGRVVGGGALGLVGGRGLQLVPVVGVVGVLVVGLVGLVSSPLGGASPDGVGLGVSRGLGVSVNGVTITPVCSSLPAVSGQSGLVSWSVSSTRSLPINVDLNSELGIPHPVAAGGSAILESWLPVGEDTIWSAVASNSPGVSIASTQVSLPQAQSLPAC